MMQRPVRPIEPVTLDIPEWRREPVPIAPKLRYKPRLWWYWPVIFWRWARRHEDPVCTVAAVFLGVALVYLLCCV